MSIVVRLYTPLTCLFPNEGSSMPHETVAAPPCILCQKLSYLPPARCGVLMDSLRQEMFTVCGECSDCPDDELERRVVEKVNEPAMAE